MSELTWTYTLKKHSAHHRGHTHEIFVPTSLTLLGPSDGITYNYSYDTDTIFASNRDVFWTKLGHSSWTVSSYTAAELMIGTHACKSATLNQMQKNTKGIVLWMLVLLASWHPIMLNTCFQVALTGPQWYIVFWKGHNGFILQYPALRTS